MKICELIPFVRKMLKGRNMAVMGICMLPLIGELFFRFAEAAVYSLLLYFGELPPIALFSGEEPLQLAVALLSFLLRLTLVPPLTYGAAARLMGLCTDSETAPIGEVLISRRNYRRSVTAALITKLLGTAALLPAAFFGWNAYRLLASGHSAGELFLTVHAFVLTAVSVGAWLSLRISLSALPLLMAACPEVGVIRLTFRAFRITSGRRTVLLKLAAAYLPMSAAVISLPFVLTRIWAAWALCISISLKEEEYNEGNKAESKYGKTGPAPEFSDEAAGHFPAAADKAQTAGWRYHQKRRDRPQRGPGLRRRRDSAPVRGYQSS